MSEHNILPEIAKRASVRSFTNRSVPRAEIDACLEAARQAPSACNKQPWHYIVVDDPVLRDRLCKESLNRPPFMNTFAAQASVLIAVASETDLLTHRVAAGLQGVQYYLLDIGASIENLMLEATRRGLGSCWIGWFSERAVKKILRLPRSQRVVSLVAMGFPKGAAERTTTRKPWDETISYNSGH